MTLVADTSIVLAAALDEPEKANIVRLTQGADAVAPEILPYEIGNALTAMCKRRRITPEQAIRAYGITKQIPIRLVAVDIGKALEIALKCDVYAYDAYFLECARSLSCPLLTLDRQMRRIAMSLGIEILEQPP